MERPYIDMTMAWMRLAGVTCSHKNYDEFYVPGRQRYRAFTAQVPADWGSSGYPMIASAITDSKVTFVGMDPDDVAGRTEISRISFRRWGLRFLLLMEAARCTVEGGKDLHGIEIRFVLDTPDAVPHSTLYWAVRLKARPSSTTSERAVLRRPTAPAPSGRN